jgi:hypothetical protein
MKDVTEVIVTYFKLPVLSLKLMSCVSNFKLFLWVISMKSTIVTAHRGSHRGGPTLRVVRQIYVIYYFYITFHIKFKLNIIIIIIISFLL